MGSSFNIWFSTNFLVNFCSFFLSTHFLPEFFTPLILPDSYYFLVSSPSHSPSFHPGLFSFFFCFSHLSVQFNRHLVSAGHHEVLGLQRNKAEPPSSSCSVQWDLQPVFCPLLSMLIDLSLLLLTTPPRQSFLPAYPIVGIAKHWFIGN